VYNGGANAWGYRGWVMCGVSLYDDLSTYPLSDAQLCGRTINCWSYYTYASSYQYGKLGSWGWAGSLHPNGCLAVYADGSSHFLNQDTDIYVQARLCNMADGMVGDLPN
ncbi:MAG: H-X9-DG-CTERM domain-containing protein, partial [Pirellulales bacterium]